MTRQEKLCYAKGYNAGRRNAWPAHHPPLPPDKEMADVLTAAQELRDATDGMCATLEESDEFVRMIGPKIDAFDAAMEKWSNKLLELAHEKTAV